MITPAGVRSVGLPAHRKFPIQESGRRPSAGSRADGDPCQFTELPYYIAGLDAGPQFCRRKFAASVGVMCNAALPKCSVNSRAGTAASLNWVSYIQAVPRHSERSRFCAYPATAALRREHVGAFGIGIVESFAVRHSRGSSESLIRRSSVQASVDIDP